MGSPRLTTEGVSWEISLLESTRELHHQRELGGEEAEAEIAIVAPTSTMVSSSRGSQQACVQGHLWNKRTS